MPSSTKLRLQIEHFLENLVKPHSFERDRVVVTRGRFLRIESPLQNQSAVIHVMAERMTPSEISGAEIRSHDFR